MGRIEYDVPIIRPTPDCPDSCLFTKVSFQRRRATGEAYDVCGIDCHEKTHPQFLKADVIFEIVKTEIAPMQRQD